MLGWLKSKRQTPEQTRAYQLGRNLADSFSDDLDRVMKHRFGPMADNFLGVLQNQLNKCINPNDAPPLTVARIEYKIFLDELDEMRTKMIEEIQTRLSDHLSIADTAGVREHFDELVRVNVSNYHRKLMEDGLLRVTDMAHALRLADDQWRAVHPELSAKYPPDE